MASTSVVRTTGTRISIVKMAVLSGIFFGVLFGGYYAVVESDPVGGIVVGGIGGALYGAGMGGFFAWMSRRASANRPALDGESVSLEGVASHHLDGVWTRGGWLYLTESALHFRANKVNLRRAPLSLALNEITEVAPSRVLGLIPTALTVTTTRGARQKFSVVGRTAWIAAIRNAVQRQLATAS